MSTVMKPKLSHIHKNTGQLGQLASDLESHPEHVVQLSQQANRKMPSPSCIHGYFAAIS